MPEEIKEKAREMARQELQRRLEDLDLSTMEAQGYGSLLKRTQAHMLSLHNLLESKYNPAWHVNIHSMELKILRPERKNESG